MGKENKQPNPSKNLKHMVESAAPERYGGMATSEVKLEEYFKSFVLKILK